MSCWVVPTLAAEYWGVSIQEIERRILAREVFTCEEAGFLLIDVEPDSPRQDKISPLSRSPVPYKPLHESELPPKIEKPPRPAEEDRLGDFRLARIQTARLRRPPVHIFTH
ncbi:MAG: hypothetical protein KatS3mg104_1912 [Phycisphaerae bacterium]|jgi:hypothetical protein|nr:MAG: hypothetical protein KatS3mg104_1912 [Phycisphaerae bacterium]